ncbi:hypothetical protein [Brunnivagina elsteri]|uniref:Uncharacterized protein n=1 Tax=Brunnivagina elsteri CCALA 953 TaxID=987040 RepID=A0A2A2TI23_9CYAN|nr:hypothetical protein [Calothrix elsteri]PAX53285.1 hypothetical protein CK510_14840 [Calothrix elsteri CCALA 953]
MNTHTFDNHYVTCPICQRNTTAKPIKTCVGLFTCPYCQERLVVSQSGNYVRDPFIFRQMMISSALRRQSRPLARILRDFVLLKRPVLAFFLGSAIVFGMITTTGQNTSGDSPNSQQTEKTDKFIDNNQK